MPGAAAKLQLWASVARGLGDPNSLREGLTHWPELPPKLQARLRSALGESLKPLLDSTEGRALTELARLLATARVNAQLVHDDRGYFFLDIRHDK